MCARQKCVKSVSFNDKEYIVKDNDLGLAKLEKNTKLLFKIANEKFPNTFKALFDSIDQKFIDVLHLNFLKSFICTEENRIILDYIIISHILEVSFEFKEKSVYQKFLKFYEKTFILDNDNPFENLKFKNQLPSLDEVLDKLKYEFYKITNLIYGYNVPLSKIPLKLGKKSTKDIENILYDNNDVIGAKIFQLENSQDLKIALDIDGFFGFFSFKKAKLILKNTVTIKLTRDRSNKKHLFVDNEGVINNIANYYSIKLGYILTPIGSADLYICIKPQNNNIDYYFDINEFLKNTRTVELAGDQNIDSAIEGFINIQNFETFFYELNTVIKSEEKLLLLESFGNKNQSLVEIDNYKGLIDKLNEAINVYELNNLKLDICVSVFKDNTVILPKGNIFKDLKITPNYNLFFCKDFCTANEYQRKFTDNNLIYNQGVFFEKNNFYSTIEDVITPNINKLWVLELSCNAIKTNLYGLTLTGSKRPVKTTFEKYGNLKNSCKDRILKYFKYRFELRIQLFQLDLTISILKKIINDKNLCHIDYNNFIEVFENSCSMFYNKFDEILKKEITFTSIVKIISLEILFRSKFLTGSTNLHILPSSIKHIISNDLEITKGFLSLPNINKVLENIYIKTDHKIVINNLINTISDENDIKSTLKKLSDFYFSNLKIKDFIFTYFENKLDNNFNLVDELKYEIVKLPEEQLEIDFNSWIKNNFIILKRGEKRNLFILIYKILCAFYNNDDQLIKENLINFFLNHNIEYVLSDRNTRIKLNMGKSKIEIKEDLINEINLYLSNINKKTNLRADLNENARITHALLLYGQNLNCIKTIYNNFVYAFLFGRNEDWIKNKKNLYNTNFKRPGVLKEILKKVRELNIESFSLEKTLEFLKDTYDVSLDGQFLTVFTKLYKLEIIEFRMLLENFDMTKMTDYDLLCTFMTPNHAKSGVRALEGFNKSDNKIECVNNNNSIKIYKSFDNDIFNDIKLYIDNTKQEIFRFIENIMDTKKKELIIEESDNVEENYSNYIFDKEVLDFYNKLIVLPKKIKLNFTPTLISKKIFSSRNRPQNEIIIKWINILIENKLVIKVEDNKGIRYSLVNQ